MVGVGLSFATPRSFRDPSFTSKKLEERVVEVKKL